ncbi:MAG TPA: zinc ribbon domain-containing protein [Chloroflexota bacterium]|nr:zinc ribbon domain-containing protein [Chloroflexota bacterium]
MPVYEYVCEDCNDRFDRLVRSFSVADEVECERCSSPHVRRLISSFAVSGLDDPITPRASTGGGCCGGSCGCGH